MIDLNYKIFYPHFNRKFIIFGVFCLCVFLLPSLCEAGYDREEYLTYCNSTTFNEKYVSAKEGCWSCAVVHWLMDAMVKSVVKLSGPILDLSKLILFLGAAIWLAMFFL